VRATLGAKTDHGASFFQKWIERGFFVRVNSRGHVTRREVADANVHPADVNDRPNSRSINWRKFAVAKLYFSFVSPQKTSWLRFELNGGSM
jgi:hypothetical protein